MVKQLDKLPETVIDAVIENITSLEDNPRPFGYKKLRGRMGFRIRYGNYRIIYDILEEIHIVDILDVGHRKNIYQ